MGDKIWLIWMIVGAVFFVGEIFTAGFFLLWFGVGAVVAGVLALLGFRTAWQWAAFAVVTAVLTIISRRFADRFTTQQPSGIGADRFLGQKGVVLEAIDNTKNTGRVRIAQDEWRANSDSGEPIPEGKTVEVTRLEGTRVVVKVSE